MPTLNHRTQFLLYYCRMLLEPTNIDAFPSRIGTEWLLQPIQWPKMSENSIPQSAWDPLVSHAIDLNPEVFFRLHDNAPNHNLYSDREQQTTRDFEFLKRLDYTFLENEQDPEQWFKVSQLAWFLYNYPQADEVIFSDMTHPLLKGLNPIMLEQMKQRTGSHLTDFLAQLQKAWVVNDVDLESVRPTIEGLERKEFVEWLEQVRIGQLQKASTQTLDVSEASGHKKARISPRI